jgi:hypothetical protein
VKPGPGLFLLGLGLGAAALAARSSSPASSPAAPPKRPPPRPRPTIYGFVYQKPDEIAFRLAEGTSWENRREVGIFGTEAMAHTIARQRGLKPAWQGVRNLQ